MLDCKTKNNIVLLVLAILVIYIGWNMYNKRENMTLSEEAVQNIASVYAEKSGTVSFNNVKVTGNLEVDTSFNMIPRGTIVAWYDDSTNNAPQGWHICDGTLGTPDLRGRFILGYMTTTYPASGLTQRAVGSMGGEENHTLSVAEIPSHTHNSQKLITGYKEGWPTQLGCGGNCEFLEQTQTSDGGTGGGGAHNNMPPFTVMKYIMKL
jgi:microcystin-dependent protein